MVPDTKRRPRSETVANGAAIRAIREARGIPLGDCASACDISYSYLSNIEAGRKNASPAVLARLAERLKCSVDAITSARPSGRGRAA